MLLVIRITEITSGSRNCMFKHINGFMFPLLNCAGGKEDYVLWLKELENYEHLKLLQPEMISLNISNCASTNASLQVNLFCGSLTFLLSASVLPFCTACEKNWSLTLLLLPHTL